MEYIEFKEFLSNEEKEELLKYIEKKEGEFVETSTVTNAEDYRRGKVLHNLSGWKPKLNKYINQYLQLVNRYLKLSKYEIKQIEMQITGYGEGDYYKLHKDVGKGVEERYLTYVYYLNKEPKKFKKGELRLYTSKGAIEIEPENNKIVFFKSDIEHEVLPIELDNEEFMNKRFTVNGWIRKGK